MLPLYIYNLIFAALAVLTPLSAWAIMRLAGFHHTQRRYPGTDTAHILTEANEQASRLLEEAAAQAQQIIRTTQTLKENTERAVQARLLEAAEHVVTDSEKMLEQLHTNFEQELNENTEHLKTMFADHLAQLTAKLQERVTEMEHTIGEQAGSQQQNLQRELVALKERIRQQYEKHLQGQLPSIVKTVVGHSLTGSDHEQLIREALQSVEQELAPTKTAHEPPTPQQPASTAP